MEEREYEPGFEPSKTWTVIKTVFKALFIGLIIFIYAFFMLRFCTSEPDTKIIWTQKALDAKEQYGDEFKVYTQKQHIFIDEYKKITTSENDLTFKRYGYNISIFDVMYIPKAQQLLVTVRYNKSIMDDLKEEYGITGDIDGEPFLYTLNFEDGTRISTYNYTASETNRYYFRYLVFDGVDLEKYELVDFNEENSAVVGEDGKIIAHETTADGGNILYESDENGMEKVYINDYVYLDTYFIDDVDFEERPISCLIVFERDIEMKEVNYEKCDKNEGTLIPSPAFFTE